MREIARFVKGMKIFSFSSSEKQKSAKIAKTFIMLNVI